MRIESHLVNKWKYHECLHKFTSMVRLEHELDKSTTNCYGLGSLDVKQDEHLKLGQWGRFQRPSSISNFRARHSGKEMKNERTGL